MTRLLIAIAVVLITTLTKTMAIMSTTRTLVALVETIVVPVAILEVLATTTVVVLATTPVIVLAVIVIAKKTTTRVKKTTTSVDAMFTMSKYRKSTKMTTKSIKPRKRMRVTMSHQHVLVLLMGRATRCSLWHQVSMRRATRCSLWHQRATRLMPLQLWYSVRKRKSK